jgi:hypothetical protein
MPRVLFALTFMIMNICCSIFCYLDLILSGGNQEQHIYPLPLIMTKRKARERESLYFVVLYIAESRQIYYYYAYLPSNSTINPMFILHEKNPVYTKYHTLYTLNIRLNSSFPFR